eukprot:6490775-Alexandrium_andersonii.AAC.1
MVTAGKHWREGNQCSPKHWFVQERNIEEDGPSPKELCKNFTFLAAEPLEWMQWATPSGQD